MKTKTLLTAIAVATSGLLATTSCSQQNEKQTVAIATAGNP